jgi:adenylate cyclase
VRRCWSKDSAAGRSRPGSRSLARIAYTLVETYLGHDAGRRVPQGRIARGVADRIKTVLWFSDLRNYTRISDSAPPEEIIPLLNDYADAIVSATHEHSGDVLKLIGDGVLAIFPAEDRARACAAVLDAVQDARESVEAVNERRRAQGLPTTDMYLGLHLGVVFYGNIGSKERLDFTVVGPAVNEVARIAALCRSVDQYVLSIRGLGRRGPPSLRFGRPLRPAWGRRAARALHTGCAGLAHGRTPQLTPNTPLSAFVRDSRSN